MKCYYFFRQYEDQFDIVRVIDLERIPFLASFLKIHLFVNSNSIKTGLIVIVSYPYLGLNSTSSYNDAYRSQLFYLTQSGKKYVRTYDTVKKKLKNKQLTWNTCIQSSNNLTLPIFRMKVNLKKSFILV